MISIPESFSPERSGERLTVQRSPERSGLNERCEVPDMTRFVLPIILAASCLLASATTAGAQEEVTYYDRAEKKETRVTGTIEEETTAGIKLKEKNAVKLIPAVDVRSVGYKNDKVPLLEFRGASTKEARALMPGERADARKKGLAEALKNYEEMAPKLKDAPAANRYVQFKLALVKFHLSRDDATQLDAALASLSAFKTEHGQGWATVQCLKMLAQLQEEKGDVDAGVKAYQDLEALPDLPGDLKRDAVVLGGKLLLRSRKFADAETKFQSLMAGSSTRDIQWAVLQVLLTQSQIGQNNLAKAEEQLKAALNAGADATVKAMIFNTLGDYFLKKEKPEDAFWYYLKVDTLYGQDKEEQAKALYHLSKLFETVKKDPLRGQQCLEKLKLMEGTEYQRRAATETK